MRKTLAAAAILAFASLSQAHAAAAANPDILAGSPAGYAEKLKARMAKVDAGANNGPFRPNWNSLEQFRTPDWFRDAKFGIFLHWGVYSVPAFANEWYPRSMYVKGTAPYAFHRAVYGDQSKFGYKDFIPMFKAEKFDPASWVALFQRAGAKYVVPVAEHCDGFAMYDSDFTDWDAAKMGPHRDVVGEIEKAARDKGMHFGLSSHRAEHVWWYYNGTLFNSDVNDPKYAGIYGPAQPMALPADPGADEPNSGHLERWMPPSKAFLDDWLARSTELVDKYHPEFIYFDWWISQPTFKPYLQKMAAYYYNEAAARHQGPVITYKGEAMAPGSAMIDIERGKFDALRLEPWQSDTSVSIASWGYVKDDKYRTPKYLVQNLADIVSKNGNLLLNVGPKADGTIPEEAQAVLLGIGAWLKVNGEAIYETRPWKIYGEGDTNAIVGEKKEAANAGFTPKDIRFTTRGDTLYAIGLEPPADGRVLMKSLYAGNPYLDRIGKIELVGSDAPVHWETTPKGLAVELPKLAGDMPYVLRITPAAPGMVASR